MITSVSKAELYGIIFGYNDAAHNPYIISTKVTAEIGTPTAAVLSTGKHSARPKSRPKALRLPMLIPLHAAAILRLIMVMFQD